ncbi:hypothetical protein GP486_006667 [Trichoglossum hirsutum]|uniref:Uncharacterized protein n=1 Tax=Trichoglossum hirsutum TaxID=265104 RepID=A0A9P8IDA2_9PEZI|nr:hypothetical protein GP486_006667 [Trichoglossum hirsutum]
MDRCREMENTAKNAKASANAAEASTKGQASDPSAQTGRQEFELNVTEEPPTGDQLRSILEYVGTRRLGEIVRGARDEADAMRKLQQNSENFQRPLIVDWNNGRAVIGDNESEILKMLETLPKS